jgi:hypothetical protein
MLYLFIYYILFIYSCICLPAGEHALISKGRQLCGTGYLRLAMSNTPLNWSWNLNKCCPRWYFYWTWSMWVWCYSQESGGEIWVDGGQIWLGSTDLLPQRYAVEVSYRSEFLLGSGSYTVPSIYWVNIIYTVEYETTNFKKPCNLHGLLHVDEIPDHPQKPVPHRRFSWHWESPRKYTATFSWLIDSQQWWAR